jgi:hypothetical protein
MEITKDYIQEQYKILESRLGRQPASKEFYAETGINERYVTRNFRTFSKLVEEMGGVPKTFGQEGTSESEYWRTYGEMIRRLSKIPTVGDWDYFDCRPIRSSYTKKFKLKWSELPDAFLQYIADKPEWHDVIQFLQPNRTTQTEHISITKSSLELKHSQFLPPVLDNILELSVSEEKSKEFEQKVGLIFQMLGYDVEEYGQGKGRNPDCIAKATQSRYAVIIDTKARRDYYKIGQEDRKFIEYINSHKGRLNHAGYDIIYFLIVSSQYNAISEIALANILKETNVQTTLISARDLLVILANKIEYPNRLGLDKLKSIFIRPGIIADEKIKGLIKHVK